MSSWAPVRRTPGPGHVRQHPREQLLLGNPTGEPLPRSVQGRGVRELRMLRATWRVLETESRSTALALDCRIGGQVNAPQVTRPVGSMRSASTHSSPKLPSSYLIRHRVLRCLMAVP